DSSRYVTRILPNVNDFQYPAQYRGNRDFWNASTRASASWEAVCDPRVGYQFIRGAGSSTGLDLLGPTPRETLTNLTAWAQLNLGHGGQEDDSNAAAEGHIFLRERLTQRSWVSDPSRTMVMAQEGCHSAANLIYD